MDNDNNSTVAANMRYCSACGTQMHITAAACPKCGAQQVHAGASAKRILPAFLFLLLLPTLGFHRFYVGKIGTGILFLITFGGLGLWWLIDVIMLLTGSFTDKQDNKITLWT
ncbi:NINE protein [Pelomonas sp. SE-A7]|uniref:TM2 domain-containing protein n=1 Tax=Pelomonas sp. SE-A7 TaxID=3054953 RepID=UPI00259D0B2B|nr:NINE protein [Pelomonas sp. SE-A7]MDM4766354.1 NINE protein [Pelomonas sp. SE-A7]